MQFNERVSITSVLSRNSNFPNPEIIKDIHIERVSIICEGTSNGTPSGGYSSPVYR